MHACVSNYCELQLLCQNRKLRAREASKFHIQLCLSLIFMLIVFVAGIDRVSVRAGCITAGVLIHYFALVSWMWMGAEALLMFQKLVIVFTDNTWKYLTAVSILCWSKKIMILHNNNVLYNFI